MEKPAVPRPRNRMFIPAWLGVLGRAIVRGVKTHRHYREETPQRRKGFGHGAWRTVIGGAGWTKRSRRNADRAFFAKLKRERRVQAARNADNHDRGWSREQHNSNRTMRRKFERANAKYLGV